MLAPTEKYKFDTPNVGGGLEMLRSLRTGIGSCVVFDPQYRGVLDQLDYGNEGARQSERAALPQMSDKLIRLFLAEIGRVLQPSRYLFFWSDKYGVCEATYKIPNLPTVDMIVWNKYPDNGRIGMGSRSRLKGEYVIIKQKPPILAKETWADHGIPDVWGEVASGHPHAKPIELQRRLIAATTKPGEIVIDPAAGSFTVMKAALSCGRRFCGIDLLPHAA